ncbi:MAG TPA: DMT family transporter [Mariprofundaceae bacterium]|nr:DMT family transporter [Mariprofundaceae bacterium]
MSIPLAYIGVIIIWSTTPLAILWSSEGVGFLFGVTSRMVIGAVLALVVAALLGAGMKWHRKALLAYMAAGIGIYGAMLCGYWAVQFIPSGWLSLIFGLSPLITGVMARSWLEDERLTLNKLAGMLIAIVGLGVIFAHGVDMDSRTLFGIAGVLLAVTIHSASGVWVKRINADVPAIVMTSGGLALAAPLFLITWLFMDNDLPTQMSGRTIGSIGYLALFGSVLGFALYYYVLRHVQATKVALITLITPVIALTLGNLLNSEPITFEVVTGTALILSGLALFQLGGHVVKIRTVFQRL